MDLSRWPLFPIFLLLNGPINDGFSRVQATHEWKFHVVSPSQVVKGDYVNGMRLLHFPQGFNRIYWILTTIDSCVCLPKVLKKKSTSLISIYKETHWIEKKKELDKFNQTTTIIVHIASKTHQTYTQCIKSSSKSEYHIDPKSPKIEFVITFSILAIHYPLYSLTLSLSRQPSTLYFHSL